MNNHKDKHLIGKGILLRLKELWEFKMSIVLKFIFIIVLINLVISFFVTSLHERDQLNEIKWEIRHEGNFFTEIALHQAETYFKNDFERINQARNVFNYMTHNKSDHEIKSIILFDRNSSFIEGFGADKNFGYNAELARRAINTRNSVYNEEGPYRLWIYTPIIEQSLDSSRNIIGVFCIDLDYTHRVAQIERDVLSNTSYFIIMGIIISALVYYIIYIIIIRPIKKLQNAVSQIGEGNFKIANLHERDGNIADEIKKLESGINKMTFRLQNLFEEKDKAAKDMRESEELYRSIINASPDGITFTDMKGNLTFASPKALETHGLKNASDVLGKSSLNWLHPSERERATLALKDVLLGKHRENNEYLLLKEGGETFWGELNTSRIDDTAGNPKGFVSITRDITKRKKFEQGLIDAKEQISLVIDSLPVLIAYLDSEQRYIYANKGYLDWFHKTRDEIIGKRVYDAITPKHYSLVKDRILEVLSGKMVKFETVMWDYNFAEYYGAFAYVPHFDDNGKVKAYFVIIQDITERKKFEQGLIDAKEQISLVIDSIPVMIAYVSSDEKYIYANKSYIDAFDKTRNEVIGKKIRDVVSDNVYTSIKDKIIEVLSGKLVRFETPLLSKDNKERYGYVTYVPHFDEKGKVKAYFVIIQDITENRKIKEELISAKNKAEISDKLKSEFLAQMSHEIRTPINAILSFTSLIQEQVGEMSGDLSDSFNIIDRAGHRIIRTIQLILDMSQIQSGTYEPAMINIDLYSDVLIKLFVDYKIYAKDKSLSLYLKKETENSELMGDEYTLRQIFSNLIDNAIKYTFKGFVEITIKRNENNNLCVTIRDTGIGISGEYQKNLFQPFTQEEMGYTRKFEGNGLGLALVKRFCEVNKADIYVESEKGKGSVFTLVFGNN